MIGRGGDLGDSFSSWRRNYEVASQVVKGKRAGGRGVPLRATCVKRAWCGEKSIRNPGHLMMSHTQKEHKGGSGRPRKKRKRAIEFPPDLQSNPINLHVICVFF